MLNYWNNYDQPLLNCFDSITSPTRSLQVIPVIQQRPQCNNVPSAARRILQKAPLLPWYDFVSFVDNPSISVVTPLNQQIINHFIGVHSCPFVVRRFPLWITLIRPSCPSWMSLLDSPVDWFQVSGKCLVERFGSRQAPDDLVALLKGQRRNRQAA